MPYIVTLDCALAAPAKAPRTARARRLFFMCISMLRKGPPRHPPGAPWQQLRLPSALMRTSIGSWDDSFRKAPAGQKPRAPNAVIAGQPVGSAQQQSSDAACTQQGVAGASLRHRPETNRAPEGALQNVLQNPAVVANYRLLRGCSPKRQNEWRMPICSADASSPKPVVQPPA